MTSSSIRRGIIGKQMRLREDGADNDACLGVSGATVEFVDE